MRNSFKKIINFAVFLAATAIPAVAAATTFPTPTPSLTSLPTSPFNKTTDVTSFAGIILLWLFWGLMILAVVMFFIGGYRYATSSGDPEKVHGANQALLFAAISAAVALIAAGLPFLIGNFFGVSVPSL